MLVSAQNILGRNVEIPPVVTLGLARPLLDPQWHVLEEDGPRRAWLTAVPGASRKVISRRRMCTIASASPLGPGSGRALWAAKGDPAVVAGIWEQLQGVRVMGRCSCWALGAGRWALDQLSWAGSIRKESLTHVCLSEMPGLSGRHPNKPRESHAGHTRRGSVRHRSEQREGLGGRPGHRGVRRWRGGCRPGRLQQGHPGGRPGRARDGPGAATLERWVVGAPSS